MWNLGKEKGRMRISSLRKPALENEPLKLRNKSSTFVATIVSSVLVASTFRVPSLQNVQSNFHVHAKSSVCVFHPDNLRR